MKKRAIAIPLDDPKIIRLGPALWQRELERLQDRFSKIRIAGLPEWMELASELLLKRGSFDRIDLLIEMLESLVGEPELWKLFCEEWSGCEGIENEDHMAVCGILEAQLACDCPAEFHLAEDDKRFYDSLPDNVEVFRGGPRYKVHGISWTTDRAVAATYARGHRVRMTDPVIARAVVPKQSIYAVITDRNESEVICLPKVIAAVDPWSG